MAVKRVLITGGAGFIGCNLADALVTQGQSITVFDNLSRRGAGENASWLREKHGEAIRVVEGDTRDYDAISRAAEGQQIIFHCAGQTAVTTSVTDPRRDMEDNVVGTFNTLEAARNHADNPIFLYTSTNKVYGGMDDVPVVERATRYEYDDLPFGASEDVPLDFHSPYGCSKGAADQYVRDYYRIYGLRTIVFRQSCIYGPRQMGVEDQGWVAWFIIAALMGRPITIYGDGKQVRDVLYVGDLVRAYQMAVDQIETTQGQVYNIGGGSQNTMSIWSDFGPILHDVLGQEVRPTAFADWRPGDQPVFVCDIRKAARDFGWQPEVGVREGIGRLADWVKANRQLFA